ncbi:MAG: hypothetical protein HY818_09625 [Acetobacterium woodii]|nr:hypothetical protein [Acetobacterium woodii]
MDTATGLLITTVIMALGAITFAALTMAFDRSHNRKSVRPFCNIHKKVTDTEINISIQNAGMGPMRIQKIVLLNNQDDFIQAGIQLGKVLPFELNCDIFIQHTDEYVLASLCELNLIQGILEQHQMTRVKETLAGYYICIEYTDVYDDVYEQRSKLINIPGLVR